MSSPPPQLDVIAAAATRASALISGRELPGDRTAREDRQAAKGVGHTARPCSSRRRGPIRLNPPGAASQGVGECTHPHDSQVPTVQARRKARPGAGGGYIRRVTGETAMAMLMGQALCHHPGTTRQNPVRAHEVAGISVRDPLEIVLVLGLSFPEGTSRLDLGHDLARHKPEA